MELERYFSESYEEARKRFLEYDRDASIISKEIPKDLFVDAAIYNANIKNKKNLLMIVSGLHGIEGKVGSAFQSLFIDNYLEKLNQETSLVLIHALNPFGFKYGRRVNENNVDLNRAFIDEMPETKDAGLLKKVHEVLTPKKPLNNLLAKSNFMKIKLLGLASKYCFTRIRDCIVCGQYTSPQSLFYGGDGEEKEVKFYRDVLKKAKGYDNLIVLDVHSGIGERYDALFLVNYKKESENFKKLAKIFPNIEPEIGKKVIRKNNEEEINSDFENLGVYDISGSLRAYTDKNSKAKDTYCITIEFGTIPELKHLFLLSAENQIYHYGGKEKVKGQIKKEFAEAFCPSEEKWRKIMLEMTGDIIEKIGRGFSLFN